MCGIYGVYLAQGGLTEADLVVCMNRLLHRGPDDAGVWANQDGRIGFAHRRLSIVDLSSKGHQPMHSADGQFVIVFNGEIYNYQQIKQSLKDLGVSFHSDSDTEVLLAAFMTWGDNCLSRLNGMFAFAISIGVRQASLLHFSSLVTALAKNRFTIRIPQSHFVLHQS
jgi:asparagine synthase (glutamine-hydrolysing)